MIMKIFVDCCNSVDWCYNCCDDDGAAAVTVADDYGDFDCDFESFRLVEPRTMASIAILFARLLMLLLHS